MMRSVILAIAAALALVACDTPQAPSPSPAESSADALSPAQQAFAEANARMHAAMSEIPPDADEAFMRGMLAHHRGAVEMAEVELRHGSDPEARQLAQTIINAQTAEIEQMEAWLEQHGIPAAAEEAMSGHQGH